MRAGLANLLLRVKETNSNDYSPVRLLILLCFVTVAFFLAALQ